MGGMSSSSAPEEQIDPEGRAALEETRAIILLLQVSCRSLYQYI